MEEILNESVWGRRNYNLNNHWERLNLKNHKITKPTIICLGGNGTMTERAANGNISILEGMLKSVIGDVDISKDIDLISVAYGKHQKKKKRAEEKTFGDMTEKEKEFFADNVLIPLCLDENGNLLDLQTIRKNFSLVTFVTHCAGAQFLNDIIECVLFKMRMTYSGFNDEYSAGLCDAIKHISYAPLNGLRQIVPTTYFFSARDESFAGTILLNDIFYELGINLKEIDGVRVVYDPNKRFMTKQPTLGVISSGLQNRKGAVEILDEHSFSILRKLQTGETIPFNGRISPNRDCFSNMMSLVIAKNVQNSFENQEQIDFVSMDLQEMKVSLEDVLSDYNKGNVKIFKNDTKSYKKYMVNEKFEPTGSFQYQN